MKCTMCDFRRKADNCEKIQLMDICGSLINEKGEQQELDFMTGELTLEKNFAPLSYNVVVTVSGVEPNGDITACTIAKFPTKICPNCGKVLTK